MTPVIRESETIRALEASELDNVHGGNYFDLGYQMGQTAAVWDGLIDLYGFPNHCRINPVR